MKGKIHRDSVWNKYDKHCGYCGKELKTIKEMQVDHITPKWMKAKNLETFNEVLSETNLMPSCRSCNHYKRGDTLEQFRHKMKTLHQRCCSHYIGKVELDFGVVSITPFDGVFFFEKFGGQDNE